MQLLLHALSLTLVAVIGYASHRASLCTVRAVADAMMHRRIGMLLSFGRAALWAAAVSGVLIVAFRIPASAVLLREDVTWALLGGLFFGIGAAINGGCSLSTLQRLVDGDRSLLLTLLAFCAGVFAWARLEAAFGSIRTAPVVSLWARIDGWRWILLGALVAWCGRELYFVLQSGEPQRLWRAAAAGKAFSFGLVGLLLGAAGGVLYTVQGAWSYTNFLRSSVASSAGGQAGPAGFHALLVLALVAGMVLSSRQRTELRVIPPLARVWRSRLAGGFLMGVGGAVVPGGNDTLVLSSIPTLSPQAVIAYLALLIGIAVVLRLRILQPDRPVAPA